MAEKPKTTLERIKELMFLLAVPVVVAAGVFYPQIHTSIKAEKSGLLYKPTEVPAENSKVFKAWFDIALTCTDWSVVETPTNNKEKESLQCKTATKTFVLERFEEKGNGISLKKIEFWTDVSKKGKVNFERVAVGVDQSYSFVDSSPEKQGYLDPQLFRSAWKFIDARLEELKN